MKIKLYVLGFPAPLVIDGLAHEAILKALSANQPGVVYIPTEGRNVNVVTSAICGWEQI